MRPRAFSTPPSQEDAPVEVWAVRLEASEDRFTECLSWLSADEAARAARFHFEQHRWAFILGRGVLRGLLGELLGMPPVQIRFAYGSKGKPSLAVADSPICFNVANSGNLAVYALTQGCDIGIDVEQVRPFPEMEHIAARLFAPGEASELLSLPEPDRAQGFFNCWTRKEAYIKAVGDGLSVPLDSFCVTLRPGAVAEMLSVRGSADAAKAWTLHDFAPAPQFVGALAYTGRERPIVLQSLVGVDDLFL